jgi:hypothetical protein
MAPEASALAATKVKSGNLIRDPGAESAKPVDQYGGTVPVPAWTPLKGTAFTAVRYGAPDFIGVKDPGPKPRGHNFFAGGQTLVNPSGATQVDSLAKYVGLIKKGKAKFVLSGWFGGWANQRDYTTLTVTWENAAGAPVGKATVIGDVTAGQRKNVIGVFARHKNGVVPKAATQATIKIKMVRLDGGYDDGYADNLGLVLSS